MPTIFLKVEDFRNFKRFVMCSVTFFSLWESYLYWCASPKEKFSHFKIFSFFWRPFCIFLFICFFLYCFTVNKDFHGICVCDVLPLTFIGIVT